MLIVLVLVDLSAGVLAVCVLDMNPRCIPHTHILALLTASQGRAEPGRSLLRHILYAHHPVEGRQDQGVHINCMVLGTARWSRRLPQLLVRPCLPAAGASEPFCEHEC